MNVNRYLDQEVDSHYYGWYYHTGPHVYPLINGHIGSCHSGVKIIDPNRNDFYEFIVVPTGEFRFIKAVSYSCGSSPMYPLIGRSEGCITAKTAGGVVIAATTFNEKYSWEKYLPDLIEKYNTVVLSGGVDLPKYNWVISIPEKNSGHELAVLSVIKFGSSDKFIDSRTGIEMTISNGVEVVNPGKCKVCGSNHMIMYDLGDYDLVEVECDACKSSFTVDVNHDIDSMVSSMVKHREEMVVRYL